MLKLNLICVGNLKDKFFIDASNEYLKRLSRFCCMNLKEIKEYTNLNNIQQIKQAESQEILKSIKGYFILLDVKGKQLSSEEFADNIQNLSNTSSELTFVIGGSYGVTDELKKLANQIISVSKMTFPHRLFRVMLLEQIYRAFTINNNISYHK